MARKKAREKGLSVDQVEDIVDADREDAVKALHQIMSEVQGQNKDVDPDIIEREVAEAVREVRKQERDAKGRS